ncbi:MAG: hypothetical protein ACYTG0_12600 [Planctomycetota bacterium]|jgi:hypothetical protein
MTPIHNLSRPFPAMRNWNGTCDDCHRTLPYAVTCTGYDGRVRCTDCAHVAWERAVSNTTRRSHSDDGGGTEHA